MCIENPCVGGSIPPQATSIEASLVFASGAFFMVDQLHSWRRVRFGFGDLGFGALQCALAGLRLAEGGIFLVWGRATQGLRGWLCYGHGWRRIVVCSGARFLATKKA
jgi:hypothetical protein